MYNVFHFSRNTLQNCNYNYFRSNSFVVLSHPYPFEIFQSLLLNTRCHALTYANFSYCEHVTDAGVELLATIPSLISLDLSGCNISDPGVVALGNNPNFRDINISECCSVTDNGIQKFVPQVKDLETLDLSHLNVSI